MREPVEAGYQAGMTGLPSPRGALTPNRPLADLTWLRVGGPADWLFQPTDEADLAAFLAALDPVVAVFPMGVGSNLIVRDGGIRAVVIRLGRGFNGVSVEGDRVMAGAGALDAQVASMNEAVQEAIARNIELSEVASSLAARQLGELEEMTISLEGRIADTKNNFESVQEDSFARRMVVLTESLNSTAIDVTKILSNEVTDTAWNAYLKGDRGVFTRRAVRLLDSSEAKIIVRHYGEDSDFREHVNRYVHDFEAIMRLLLSTRDGNAIGVTLLSSDIGKLYVALAQAIERLRR